MNSMYMSNDNEWEKDLLQEGTVLRIIGFIMDFVLQSIGIGGQVK